MGFNKILLVPACPFMVRQEKRQAPGNFVPRTEYDRKGFPEYIPGKPFLCDSQQSGEKRSAPRNKSYWRCSCLSESGVEPNSRLKSLMKCEILSNRHS